ncbi:MAG: lysoplasmalogenase [Hyphomicrobiales bacterium]|nr:lysoplasmalogenase [Hyphomicrobiales bacterium]
MENSSLFLLLIAVACGFIYGLLWLSQDTTWIRGALKTLPVTLLAFTAVNSGLPLWLIIAFCLSAAGDAFLSRTGDNSFLAGLSAFLLAHLAYTCLFLTNPPSQAIAPDTKIWVWLLTCLLIISVLISLWSHLGHMKIAVLIYSVTIGAMNIAAWTSGQNNLLLSGVALFVFSDIVLAHGLFVWKNVKVKNLALLIVWYSYFPAQTLILYSFLN